MRIYQTIAKTIREYADKGEFDLAVNVWKTAYRCAASSQSDRFLLNLFKETFGTSFADFIVTERAGDEVAKTCLRALHTAVSSADDESSSAHQVAFGDAGDRRYDLHTSGHANWPTGCTQKQSG